MRLRQILLYALALTTPLTLTACGQGAGSQPKATASPLSLTWLQNLGQQSLSPSQPLNTLSNDITTLAENQSSVIALGTLKSTDSYYFILANNSGRAVNNITLTSSNPAFLVTPSKIDTLSPGTAVGMLPVIRVKAVHGLAASGVGFAPAMPPGLNSTTVDIQGQTTDGSGNITTVALNTVMQVEAKVMGARLFADETEVDLSKPGSVDGHIARYSVQHSIDPRDVDLRFENTGNVPVIVASTQDQNMYGSHNLIEPTVIQPGQSKSFHLSNFYGVCLSLDGEGVARDTAKLIMYNDGKSYMCIHSPYP